MSSTHLVPAGHLPQTPRKYTSFTAQIQQSNLQPPGPISTCEQSMFGMGLLLYGCLKIMQLGMWLFGSHMVGIKRTGLRLQLRSAMLEWSSRASQNGLTTARSAFGISPEGTADQLVRCLTLYLLGDVSLIARCSESICSSH